MAQRYFRVKRPLQPEEIVGGAPGDRSLARQMGRVTGLIAWSIEHWMIP
jgi:type IV secretory pathway TrbD component